MHFFFFLVGVGMFCSLLSLIEWWRLFLVQFDMVPSVLLCTFCLAATNILPRLVIRIINAVLYIFVVGFISLIRFQELDVDIR